MRCLNCQTVLMDTDTRCPMCGMTTQFGQAAATSLVARAAIDPRARRQFFIKKWIYGLLLVPGGVLVTLIGVAMYLEAQTKRPVPQEMTAADLLKIDRPEKVTDWITYLPPKSVDTGVQYVKLRSQQATSKFYLLQVQDRWLMAKVDASFNGVRIEGKLEGLDTVALPKIQSSLPHESKRLLPYQIDAEYDIAGTQRQNSILGGAVGVFGVLMCISGIGYLIAKPPPFVGPAQASSAVRAQPQLISLPEAAPEPRSGAMRVFFGIVWAIVLFMAIFFAGAIVAAALATQGAGDDPELRKQLMDESGKRVGPWLMMGSFFLAILLASLGRLPGTRR